MSLSLTVLEAVKKLREPLSWGFWLRLRRSREPVARCVVVDKTLDLIVADHYCEAITKVLLNGLSI